ncbi:DUF3054 domain-containing protein [Gordonia sp. (in: high G+C Gram-positive bacteria)]|uniref:DUF3054 domain-containing protein n=1 Tax=unclassified Gordonia (in: high G+C Gram-positive bacteria) TaxID=2657482 RepID=UPI00260AB68E|nr:DUF3054 domain-containing protein [Gordonia sp. (in: high G+C Gram-positive bacteria)]
MSTAATRAWDKSLVLTAITDLAAIVAFVAIGRGSHDEAFTIAGFSRTLWPFLVGAVIGWALGFLINWVQDGGKRDVIATWRPMRIFPDGVVIWVSTVVLGMLLRVSSSQGTAASFLIVATISTAVLLLGWRLAVAITLRVRSGRVGS